MSPFLENQTQKLFVSYTLFKIQINGGLFYANAEFKDVFFSMYVVKDAENVVHFQGFPVL